MTKYVTTPEAMHKCVACKLNCAKRELVRFNEFTWNCPRCGQNAVLILVCNGEEVDADYFGLPV